LLSVRTPFRVSHAGIAFYRLIIKLHHVFLHRRDKRFHAFAHEIDRTVGIIVLGCPSVCASVHVGKKVKFSHTRYRALGPELIPVYRQSARR